jgi:hypothetical protein
MMEKKPDGKYLGSFTWNRASRKRDEQKESEDWVWHDKD